MALGSDGLTQQSIVGGPVALYAVVPHVTRLWRLGTARIHLYDSGGAGALYWDAVQLTPVMR